MPFLTSEEQSQVRFFFAQTAAIPGHEIYYADALEKEYDDFEYVQIQSTLTDLLAKFSLISSPTLVDSLVTDIDQDISYTSPNGGVTNYGQRVDTLRQLPSLSARNGEFNETVERLALMLDVNLFSFVY